MQRKVVQRDELIQREGRGAAEKAEALHPFARTWDTEEAEGAEEERVHRGPKETRPTFPTPPPPSPRLHKERTKQEERPPTEIRMQGLLEILTGRMEHQPPRERQIFASRHLSLEEVEWLGFDMDYTLVRYLPGTVEKTSYHLAVKNLVSLGYAEEILGWEYEALRAVRGVVIDKVEGNLLMLDRHRQVTAAYHGHRLLTEDERRHYHLENISLTSTDRFYLVDTLFSIPEACLYADMVEYLEKRCRIDPNPPEEIRRRHPLEGLEVSFVGPSPSLRGHQAHDQKDPRNTDLPPLSGFREEPSIDFLLLFNQIRRCFDLIHAEQALHRTILQDLQAYVFQDREIAMTLQRFRMLGKKIFLLTNSEWGYTDRVMRFLLETKEEQRLRWTDYFDLILVSARKPSFFSEERPLIPLSPEGQPLEEAGLHEKDGEEAALKRGEKPLPRFFRGGNLKALNRLLESPADRVLYVGDHIFGDVLSPKKKSAWRTMMIVEELEEELLLLQEVGEDYQRLEDLEEERARQDAEWHYQAKVLERLETLETSPEEAAWPWAVQLQEKLLEAAIRRTRRSVQEIFREREITQERIAEVSAAIRRHVHPRWGMRFRTQHEYSHLGEQIRTYACLYSSRVSNFLYYAPHYDFRPPRPFLPHEIATPSKGRL